MSYKLIAVDLDDTLLNSRLQISPRVKNAIAKAVSKGLYVVLCTGRILKGSRRFYDELGLQTLMITTGGAEIYDSGGKHVYSHNMDPAVVKKLIAFSQTHGVHFQVYMNGELVYREKNAYSESYEQANSFTGTVRPDLFELERIETPKVLMIADIGRMDALQASARKEFPMLSVRRSKPTYLEFSSLDVSKGDALRFVADYYGVDMNDVVAVGDAEIDIPMIKYAGLGVAVANAVPLVKQAADVICASNDEDGVADIIEEYVLGGTE